MRIFDSSNGARGESTFFIYEGDKSTLVTETGYEQVWMMTMMSEG